MVALAELLHHGIECVLFLDFLEFFFADFCLVKNACEQTGEKIELAVPRSACPGTLERYLDIAVGEYKRDVFLARDIDGFFEFGAGLYSRLCSHALLV